LEKIKEINSSFSLAKLNSSYKSSIYSPTLNQIFVSVPFTNHVDFIGNYPPIRLIILSKYILLFLISPSQIILDS